MTAICVGIAVVGIIMFIVGLACIRLAARAGKFPE